MKALSRQETADLMQRAIQTNQDRDRMERKAGFAAVSDCDQGERIRTAQIAIQAGFVSGDLNCFAEAAAILSEVTKYVPWKS